MTKRMSLEIPWKDGFSFLLAPSAQSEGMFLLFLVKRGKNPSYKSHLISNRALTPSGCRRAISHYAKFGGL